MRTILSLDSAGRIIIPKAIREKLHLGPGTSLRAEVIGDRIELTQVLPEIRLEKKGKRRVVVGTGSPDTAMSRPEGDHVVSPEPIR